MRSLLALYAFFILVIPASTQASTVYRISRGLLGVEPNETSANAEVSGNGRFVAFVSSASNLVPHDTNQNADVFVFDRIFGTTERISVSTNGRQGDNYATSPSISHDGRYVAFSSPSTNIVEGDTNLETDIFVHDRLTRETSRVSVSTSGTEANDSCRGVGISPDGRVVMFASDASNLVTGDVNGHGDVFAHDRSSGETKLVSVATSGEQGNSLSDVTTPAISYDGRYIAFFSYATNLVAGDDNQTTDVFLRDMVAGTTVRVSLSSAGVQANEECYFPSISYNGRYVAFESRASTLVPGDTNNDYDVFLRDVLANVTTRVSVATGGGQGNGRSRNAGISGDGRVVAFDSTSTNLSPEDTDQGEDVYRHDRLLSQTAICSIPTLGGQSNGDAIRPSSSFDGTITAFQSRATNLDPPDTNGEDDVFVHTSSGQILPPTNWQPIRGVLVSGSFASLLSSDDNHAVFRPGVVFTTQQSPVEFQVDTETIVETAAHIQLFVESSASSTSIQITLALHDFVSNQKVVLGTSQSTTGDSTISRFTIGNAARFVDGTGRIRATLSWRANGPVFSYPWQCRIDRVFLAVSP